MGSGSKPAARSTAGHGCIVRRTPGRNKKRYGRGSNGFREACLRMPKYREVPAALVVCTLVACTLATSTAFAQVYKCAGEGGHPVYQEMPCTKGKELRNFQNDPPEI